MNSATEKEMGSRPTVDRRPTFLKGEALVIDLAWEAAVDLDLAALGVDEIAGTADLVYFGRRGTRCEAPFMHLAIDHSGEGRRKQRREHLVVSRQSSIPAIYLFTWDHDAFDEGKRSNECLGRRDWSLSVRDRHNSLITTTGVFEKELNLSLVGMIRDSQFKEIADNARVQTKADLLSTVRSLAGVNVEIAS